MTLLILELLIAALCLVALGTLLGWALWGRTAMLDRAGRHDAEQMTKAAEHRATDLEAGTGDAVRLAEEVARLRHMLAESSGQQRAAAKQQPDAEP